MASRNDEYERSMSMEQQRYKKALSEQQRLDARRDEAIARLEQGPFAKDAARYVTAQDMEAELERLKAESAAAIAKPDLVRSPNHYTWHPEIECKDVVQEFDYNLGVAIAYIWRCNHKGQKIDDILKAIQHLQFELSRSTGDD